jgi:hypothetical protein
MRECRRPKEIMLLASAAAHAAIRNKPMKRTIIAALLLAGSALGAAAETRGYVFKDVLKPLGHDRSADVRHEDGRACGATGDLDMPADVTTFKRCMLARGWRFARTLTERSPAPVESGPLACTAKVLQIQDTDIGLNDGALAGLTLRVTPPRGRPFVTTVWKEVSMEQPPRKGGTIRVTCDPANPSDIHPID